MTLSSRVHSGALTRGALTGALTLVAALVLAQPAEAQRTPETFFSPNGGAASAIAEKLNGAQSTVDIAMYSISTHGDIWDALEAAVNRGITVRVVLNKAKASNKTKAAALEALGVHVFTTSRTMHEKFALIDSGTWYRRKLINGSGNWSTGAEFRYSENTVVYNRHYGLFYAFQQEFNDLLALSRPVSVNAADHDEPVSLRRPSSRVRRRERAVFTSWNSGGSTVVADEIIAMMQRAQTSIKIDVAHFNSHQIANALIAVHQQSPDVQIEVLLDLGEFSDSKSRAKKLERGGINVRYKTYSLGFHHPRSQLLHHKTMIIDDEDMITGSYNWSTTAEQKNYENVIVVEGTGPNRPFVSAFVAEHDRLWGGGRDVYPDFLAAVTASPGDPEYRRVLPVHFDTDYFRGFMTLTRDELTPLRRVAFRSGLFGNPGASYLDKEERKVFNGTLPDDRFLDAPSAITAGNTSGLAGGLGN